MLLILLITALCWLLGGLPGGNLREHGLSWGGVLAIILAMLLGLCWFGKL